MEEFQYLGIWWRPEDPDQKIAGELAYHPKEGATLKLIGSLNLFIDRSEITLGVTPHEIDIILGITPDGREITLYRCSESRKFISPVGVNCFDFKARVVFVGQHFESKSDILFNNLSICYSNLSDWTNLSPFHISCDDESIEMNYSDLVTSVMNFNRISSLINSEEAFQVNYSPLEDIGVNIDGFKIDLTSEFECLTDIPESISLRQTTYFKVEPQEPLHYDEYSPKILYHLRNFLSLGIRKSVYPVCIKGQTVASNNVLSFYRIGEWSTEKLHPGLMLFSFADVKDNFEKCLENWVNKSKLLKPIVDLYFASLHNSSMYLEHQFLSLAQALESYHRRKYGGRYLEEGRYEEIYQAFISQIPNDLDKSVKDAFKGKLKYINEYSLRKRLRQLLKSVTEITDLTIKDPKIFAHTVTQIRNDLTHLNTEEVLEGYDLARLTRQMKELLEICLLIEIGLPGEKVKDLVINSGFSYFHPSETYS